MNSPKHWPENWSHQVTLLTISNADERLFYEIEARENSWGARELERQIAASLYERLALSRDKAAHAKRSCHRKVCSDVTVYIVSGALDELGCKGDKLIQSLFWLYL